VSRPGTTSSGGSACAYLGDDALRNRFMSRSVATSTPCSSTARASYQSTSVFGVSLTATTVPSTSYCWSRKTGEPWKRISMAPKRPTTSPTRGRIVRNGARYRRSTTVSGEATGGPQGDLPS
jgi:hypothetical protein